MCAQDQLHELYHYKLNEQRALDTPQVPWPLLLRLGRLPGTLARLCRLAFEHQLLQLSKFRADTHSGAQGGIKALRPPAPASAPAALAPPLQQYRPANLTLPLSAEEDHSELAGRRDCAYAAVPGYEGWRAAAVSGSEHGAVQCADRSGEVQSSGGALDADAEISALLRTLSPSAFSFSELLCARAECVPRGGGGGSARRHLDFGVEGLEGGPCGESGLCDSRDSAPHERASTRLFA